MSLTSSRIVDTPVNAVDTRNRARVPLAVPAHVRVICAHDHGRLIADWRRDVSRFVARRKRLRRLMHTGRRARRWL